MLKLKLGESEIELAGDYGTTWFGRTEKGSMSITSFNMESGIIEISYIPKNIVAQLLSPLVGLMIKCIGSDKPMPDGLGGRKSNVIDVDFGVFCDTYIDRPDGDRDYKGTMVIGKTPSGGMTIEIGDQEHYVSAEYVSRFVGSINRLFPEQ